MQQVLIYYVLSNKTYLYVRRHTSVVNLYTYDQLFIIWLCIYRTVLSIIPWRRIWQTTPVFLPGKSHGQRSLAGCSLWGCKETDMAEGGNTHSKNNELNICDPSRCFSIK